MFEEPEEMTDKFTWMKYWQFIALCITVVFTSGMLFMQITNLGEMQRKMVSNQEKYSTNQIQLMAIQSTIISKNAEQDQLIREHGQRISKLEAGK